ncbi:MAG: M20/M25/M40 family metallo-hydrolase [Fibrella sp.]|nr:M20/M25/M40 family metallo-hydrolase [Armatimonadota bacterium]
MLPLFSAFILGSTLAATPAAHARQTAPVASPTPTPLSAPATDATSDPLARIRDEGINRSRVMETISYLSDVIGPRLTNSPGMKRANLWTASKLTEWGLANAHQEAWGPFGRGWSLQKFSAQVLGATPFPLIAYPKAWSPGIKGTLTAPVVYFNPTTEAALASYKGKLKGAIVLNGTMRELPAHFAPQAQRYSDEELLKLAQASKPEPGARRQGGSQATPTQRAATEFAARRTQFLYDEGAAVLIDAGRNGDDGTVYVQSATVPQPLPTPQPEAQQPAAPGTRPVPPRRVTAWSKEAQKKKIIPQLVIASEQYNRLARMTLAGEPVKMAVDLQVKFHDDDLMGYNTVAEIPGTDKKDEVVMCGAHMDSWHTGTGATDNAAGSAVCMEAVRILKALNLPLRRTVRVALWSGEEQGLYGSEAYVTQHFGTMERGVLKSKPEQAKISAYFNLDNGTGKVRGVYAQSNDGIMPIFADWLKPFGDLGATTVTIRNTGGTDHTSFDSVNIPGFQFIQDEIEYDTRTHHSNMDVFDRIQADDMKQASVLMAAFLYNAAQRDELLPRKPIPAPPAQTAPSN